MTSQEAIKIIETAIAEVEWEYPMNYAVAFETAIKALEKQIPKKCETNLSYPEDKYCPNCLENFTGVDCSTCSGENFKYCPSCGQALDWERGY